MTTETQQHYYYGTGRRKTSTARVRVYPTPGGITVNGKPFEEVFGAERFRNIATAPLRTVGMEDQITIMAKIAGGGTAGWAGALAHGLARALQEMDPSLRPQLKAAGHLTRDPRMKESKKYGLKKARKAPQYTKR
ncbi:MAG: 30S ribosomal protein S9 [Chloroflexota bacterium]